jgi:D-arabinose 1-dehydrogenase-like Zn-dependent alcohol dehydrogenase
VKIVDTSDGADLDTADGALFPLDRTDRVAAETHVPCSLCFQCTSGFQHICRRMKILVNQTDN